MREEKQHTRELIHRAREEEDRLREERDKAWEESRRAKEDKERLESKVSLLQERCDHLSCRVRYSLPTADTEQLSKIKVHKHDSSSKIQSAILSRLIHPPFIVHCYLSTYVMVSK